MQRRYCSIGFSRRKACKTVLLLQEDRIKADSFPLRRSTSHLSRHFVKHLQRLITLKEDIILSENSEVIPAGAAIIADEQIVSKLISEYDTLFKSRSNEHSNLPTIR